ncbi:MAG: PRTRC system protein F [Sterolibacteriaceae bacterium]|uniref:PRTRC system protein F n=1 Tax=Candidatus Methylophosphatis roskildensis TaxID=2899263 RepID=A0A9D7HNE3_9PROT|nr:PRTRC system protein F [Candidatus Methylophosphatis roskildensis]MBK7238022.1 PRTRC system protein F [Sterolibacteriaceae bacterium]
MEDHLQRHPVRTGAQRAAHRGRLAQSRATALSRCVLADGVPAQLTCRHDGAGVARFALLLLDTGILPPKRWVRSERRLKQACAESFSEWIGTQTGPLQVLQPRFGAQIRVHMGSGGPEHSLTLGWASDKTAWITIGPCIRVLEALHPGLGRTVMHALHRGGFNSIPIFSFDYQLDICECYFWGGCTSEREYLEAFGLDEDEAEGYLSEVLSREDVLRETPEDVFRQMRGPAIPDESLREIADGSLLYAVRRIAELLLDVGRIGTVGIAEGFHDHHRDQGGEFVGFGAIVQWSDSDLTGEVAERYGGAACESGTDYWDAGSVGVDIEDSEDFARTLDELRPMLRLIRILDELLWLASDPEWSIETLEQP